MYLDDSLLQDSIRMRRSISTNSIRIKRDEFCHRIVKPVGNCALFQAYSFLFVEANLSDVHFYYSMVTENLDRCIHIRSENFCIYVEYEIPLEKSLNLFNRFHLFLCRSTFQRRKEDIPEPPGTLSSYYQVLLLAVLVGNIHYRKLRPLRDGGE